MLQNERSIKLTLLESLFLPHFQLSPWFFPNLKFEGNTHTNTNQNDFIFGLYQVFYPFLLRMLYGLPWWLRWWGFCLQHRRPGFDPWVRKIPWRREWLPMPVFYPSLLTASCTFKHLYKWMTLFTLIQKEFVVSAYKSK